MSTIEQLKDDELQPFYESYMKDCAERGLRGSLSDFMVWLEEQHPEMFDEI